jgi:hypothetical protein
MDAVIVQIGQAGFAVNAAGELSYAYPSAATTRNALPQATPGWLAQRNRVKTKDQSLSFDFNQDRCPSEQCL